MGKSAVLYDYMQVKGGAESVTLTLCNEMPDMDLVTAFMSPEVFPQAPIAEERIKTLVSPTTRPGWQVLKSALAFEHKTQFLEDYETLIFSGSVAPLAVKNSRATKNICYCHTPPRFLYDLREYYLEAATKLQKPFLKALINYLQPRYEDAMSRMDVIFANSVNVQTRLKKYLNLEAEVLYPPCDTDGFEWMSEGDYFLSTARLEPLKRVEVIIEAFKEMPHKRLVVASGGSQFGALMQLASGSHNISFTGWVSDDELRRLVGNCIATIYVPKDEDFGISPIQSVAAGKLVIGVDEGGVAETIRNGIQGMLIPAPPSAARIREAVAAIENFKPELCSLNAENFPSRQMFIAKLSRSLEPGGNVGGHIQDLS